MGCPTQGAAGSPRARGWRPQGGQLLSGKGIVALMATAAMEGVPGFGIQLCVAVAPATALSLTHLGQGPQETGPGPGQQRCCNS